MSEVLAQLEKKGGGSADLVVTTIINKQNNRTYTVKKGALYLIVSRTSGGHAPSYSGASVQVISEGDYSASAGSGYYRFITIIKALEDGTVTMSYGSTFIDCSVYEVIAD